MSVKTDPQPQVTHNNDEEDLENFFLQPTSAPYNITEKVQEANFLLYNSTPHHQSRRSSKVKFREELVSVLEPDLTDDDVNSIESDHVDEILKNEVLGELKNEEIIEENKLKSYNTIILRDFLRENNNDEEIIDETIILEELVSSDDDELILIEDKIKPDPIIIKEIIKENIDKTNVNNNVCKNNSVKILAKKRKINRTIKLQEIRCKEHCVEKIDSNLSFSIRKLDIQEKPLINLPPLHLHQRKCCDDNIKLSNNERNLPNYKGTNSEYGLSSKQIKNRNRYMEMIRQKEAARQKLIEEFRILKIRQNEEVFCQWLREVTKRTYGKNLNFAPKKLVYSPSRQELVKKKIEENRPKTAAARRTVSKNELKTKKRPHTTQTCVFIEVSPKMLKKGIKIGDLLMTKKNSKELMSNKLHIINKNSFEIN